MHPRSKNIFAFTLVAFVLVYFCYGLVRLRLGVDFMDEGSHVSWPLRMLFGERLFASESAMLLRPLIGFLSMLFKVHPTLTLYEFRLLGWSIHLVAFVILSIYLFRLSNAPLQSLLVASVPLFVCNILGLASPSYYTLSSDFLLMALSLIGLAAEDGMRRKRLLNIAGGLALFIATMAHTALGLVAAIILARELLSGDLAQNVWRRKITPSNAGVLVFVVCWAAFLLYVFGTDSHLDWYRRITLFGSFTTNPLHSGGIKPIVLFAGYPFYYSRLAVFFSLAGLIGAFTLYVFSRTNRVEQAGSAGVALAFMLVASLIFTFSYDTYFLPTSFALVSLLLVATHCLGPVASILRVNFEFRFLMAMSGIAAFICAAATYYFSAHRSWLSGILPLPFAFAVGLMLLLRAPGGRATAMMRMLTTAALGLAVACVAGEHYRFIFCDGWPVRMVAPFRTPKLRHIYSTPERTQAIDALYDHLHSKLTRGESFLAFDECPMLYFIFDVKPAYGLTWASQFHQTPASLQELNREFKAKPLPRYAVRNLVNIAYPVWKGAQVISYENYPLNETVMANYALERTIFPFEVWRLRTVAP